MEPFHRNPIGSFFFALAGLSLCAAGAFWKKYPNPPAPNITQFKSAP